MIQPLVQELFGDDPAISSGVIALFVFSVLAPWWPNQESDWTEIWSVSYSYLAVHMKSLVPKRYKSIFVYSRKMQSKFGIYLENV
jgi:hypothetical protein